MPARSSAASTASAPSSTAWRSRSAPPNLPIGVRAPATITDRAWSLTSNRNLSRRERLPDPVDLERDRLCLVGADQVVVATVDPGDLGRHSAHLQGGVGGFRP